MKKISELMRLDGRSALITGGAGHIGLAIAETLLELGARVAIVDKGKTLCNKRCQELNQKGYRHPAIPIVADLLVEKQTRSCVHQAVKQLGGLDIIVHSAAFVGTTKFPGWTVPFPQQSLKAWDAAMRVNVSSAFVLTQEAKPYLEKSDHASVIFISSIYGVTAPDMSLYEGTDMNHPAAYGVSKAGLIQLARYLATSLAPRIRVNVISPGGVWRNQNEKFHQRYKKRTPLGRMATEEDLKGAFAYLASDLSKYVTGHNLIVDGGWVTW